MRVVAGEFRGRKLNAVPGMATRPTTDKVKEAIFNIIGPYFNGGTSLDLFAGSGGLSIEGVSRGIAHAVLVDRQYQAIKTIQTNIEFTHHPEKFTVLKRDARRVLAELASQGTQFDLIYLDPPYAKQQIIDDLAKMQELNLVAPGATIVCETNTEANLPATLPGLTCVRQATYGITVVTIYRAD
ncbi:16S rRNA (guanine(966)-N(2))-methyltransferase RsmD [Limosilactobacillus equigenerosi]|uniref:N6-adenine-specific methylase n=1 Tax=Limosilactobacillus equigenerosi DSM 18793 = JCM 14505 TaxID=1423742 RepID=A0A0R1US12_9LACO|nr:16S rRNA (guanine(966)-N(2))-methyltransferase RsmD [Limosilactobacillus equigenerosi]KRL95977.1 N6-adenine-specific methylase [Limosilactobacillus equigenerosi DSM 18793 = JCM 14505]